MPEPASTVGYAVVGLGQISQGAMLPAFENAGRNSRLSALVSGSAAKRQWLAARYGLADADGYGYDDYEACLDRDDVHAVYVAVPNHLHREYTIRAAERGVHVLCEKPMAVTEEDCRAMTEACRRNGVKLMVAYRLHLDPANLQVIEQVEDGAIGETRCFSSTFTQQVEEGDVRLVPASEGGGPLYDIGTYCVNAARYFFRSEPESVWATRASRPQERFDQAAEMISCVMRFPGERLAAFTCSFGAYTTSVFHLVGDRGELRLENAYNYVGDRTFVLRGEDGEPERRTIPESDQFGSQLLYFSDCILDDREPEPDGEEGRVDVAIIRALLESVDTGRAVEPGVHRDRRPEPEQAIRCPPVESPEMVDG